MMRRKGLSLIELIVVLGIIALLIGLLVPAIQRVRDAAARTQSSNNLRQIALAVHHYAESHGGAYPNTPADEEFGLGAMFAILPYIEHGDYYSNVKSGAIPVCGGHLIKVYMSPADPSLAVRDSRGSTSYAPNAQVFVRPAPLRAFADGASNTLMVAEHYAIKCDGRQFSWFWGEEPVTVPDPVLGGNITLRRATFADAGDVVPLTSGSPPVSVGSVPGLTFQVRPRLEDCDPRIPQTPHPGGMLVALGDGGVRTLNPNISRSTFWSAVTPDKGETLGPDW